MSNDSAHALTQCQHIAYDTLVKVEEPMQRPAGSLSTRQLRQAVHTALEGLRAVNRIAETGVADRSFVRLLQADDDQGDSPADPRRDEDNQAALEADRRAEEIILGITVGSTEDDVAEAAGMSTSDGLGVEVDRAERRLLPDDDTRRRDLIRMRLDWLRREGWENVAIDYEDGEVTLTELLRRLNDEPAVVEQIATWLEEDAAETPEQPTYIALREEVETVVAEDRMPYDELSEIVERYRSA